MIASFDHRNTSARPIPGGHASRKRRPQLGAVLAVLCACNGNTLNLGESDGTPDVDSGANAGDGGRGGGSGGSSSGGSGNLGAGGSSGGGTLGDGGTLDGGGTLGGGGSCPGGGSAGDPQPWWHYTNEHSCQSEGVPSVQDRPVCDGPSLPPIYMAMSRIRLGTANDDVELTPNANAWRDIGFDLDKRCTTSFTCEGPTQEPINDSACRHPFSQIPYDGNQCRDNEFSKLFRLASSSPSIGVWFGMTEADWNCELHRGGFGMMFKISDYNGERDDRQVRLDVYSTLGLERLPTWTCRNRIEDALVSNWPSRAPWRADEPWKIANTSISLSAPVSGNELPDARVFDPAAFVRNGYLFAKLPENSHFWLNGENTPIPGFSTFLYRGILTGALVKLPVGTWAIDDGTLGGVVRPDQLLESFESFGFCHNLCVSYDQVKDYLNTYRDALTSTTDILPDTPCDGMTFGAKFAARQAAATSQNVAPTALPVSCPQPRHPDAPRQGCICPAGGGRCELPDGGS